jgi:hypothetical protein
VTIHDGRQFRAMQQTSKRISLPEVVFSRVKNYVGGRNDSIRIIEAKIWKLLPLKDTGRLYESVTNADSPDIRVEVTSAAIAIINLVPYAPKHMTGVTLVNINVYDLFEFGALEQQRLRDRVPPPPIKGTRDARRKHPRKRDQGNVKGLKGDVLSLADAHTHHIIEQYGYNPEKFLTESKDIGDLKSSRPYYRLYNWAKNRYPTSEALPKRNWIYPLPPEVVQRIGSMIILDLMERNGL